METYAEKLNSPEWQKLRLEIIASNHWTCECCHNNKITKLEEALFHSVKPYENSKVTQNGLFSFIINFSIEGFIFSAFHWTKNKKLFDNLKLNDSTNIFYESSQDEKGVKYNKVVAFKNGNEWIYVSNMHVHHTYYQEDLNPWEYPKKSLKTLCWDCHEKLHENTYISHYDKNGKEIGKFKTCWKCYGAGYLPEYHYFQSGVCFGCNGQRYNAVR